MGKAGEITIIESYPILELTTPFMPLPGTEIFFNTEMLNDELAHDIYQKRVEFILTAMAKPGKEKMPDELYEKGVIAQIEGLNDEGSMIFVTGLHRVEIRQQKRSKSDYRIGSIKKSINDLDEVEFMLQGDVLIVNPDFQKTFDGLFLNIRILIENLISQSLHYTSAENLERLEYLHDYFDNFDLTKREGIDGLVWNIVHSIPYLTTPEKQYFIEETRLSRRIGACQKILEKTLERINDAKIISNTSAASSKFLADGKIQREDKPDPFMNGAPQELIQKYKKFLEVKTFMSEDAVKSIMDSFKRLKSLSRSRGDATGSEWTIFMTHVDFMLETPWNQETKEETDHNKVEAVLNSDHYGLDFAKIHILRYLAGKILNPKGRSENLCFVGPPGVGKTSLANSIAGALGRKLVRLSLGGVRDEAEIRGHRKTYVGALAGQIMQEMRRASVRNPIFVLDELDKIAADFRGDPSAALLEVLDPEQNHSFRDHYLDAPYDLSHALFIATANNAASIRHALLDRLELVNLPGYSTYEKVQIAKKFLIPKAMANVGLTEHKIYINWPNNRPDETILYIIKSYTKEAGVRSLERRIRTICRSLAQEYLKNKEKFLNPVIDENYITKIMGQPRYTEHRASKTGIGEAIGLAWTPFGGDILYIQAASLPEFKGKELSMTGSLGKSMQESGKVAMSLLRKRLEKENLLSKIQRKSIHIHVPEGAIKKDGPSAGITMFSSLYSAATQKILRPYIAMTGEITLTGKVLRIGGVKEKVIAAENSGIQEIILPETNKGDLDEVPQDVKDKLKFHFVSNIDEVLDISLDIN